MSEVGLVGCGEGRSADEGLNKDFGVSLVNFVELPREAVEREALREMERHHGLDAGLELGGCIGHSEDMGGNKLGGLRDSN